MPLLRPRSLAHSAVRNGRRAREGWAGKKETQPAPGQSSGSHRHGPRGVRGPIAPPPLGERPGGGLRLPTLMARARSLVSILGGEGGEGNCFPGNGTHPHPARHVGSEGPTRRPHGRLPQTAGASAGS